MKSDKKIIDILNDLLTGELTAVDQYLIHGEMYSDMGFQRLAEKALHESAHEQQHALAIVQRILFLEGTPNLAKRNAMTVGKTVPEMLKADICLPIVPSAAIRSVRSRRASRARSCRSCIG